MKLQNIYSFFNKLEYIHDLKFLSYLEKLATLLISYAENLCKYICFVNKDTNISVLKKYD